jgi:adenosylmethionine-8-amino-7-oxononanoate aminotransferase
MAYQYWGNKGEDRRLFLSFEGGYHGDTYGAMSVGNKSGYFDAFKELFFKVLFVPYPGTWDDAELENKESAALAMLEEHLDKHGSEIAALIVEPLIQGAIGMRMCRPEFLRQVIATVRKHGILVIFDEVMAGFFRTGTLFAFEQVNDGDDSFTPDILCVSKGISGGFLPLSMTITGEKIYQAFLSDEWRLAFIHGHSYTANPIACAAAVASLELLMSNETQAQIEVIKAAHVKGHAYLKANCPKLKNFRRRGTVAAFSLDTEENFNAQMKKEFHARGYLIRPLGNEVYLLPPYCVTEKELEGAYQMMAEVLNSIIG